MPRIRTILATAFAALLVAGFSAHRWHRANVQRERARDSAMAAPRVQRLRALLDSPLPPLPDCPEDILESFECRRAENRHYSAVNDRRDSAFQIARELGGLGRWALPMLSDEVRNRNLASGAKGTALELFGWIGRGERSTWDSLGVYSTLDTGRRWKSAILGANIRSRSPLGIATVAASLDTAKESDLRWRYFLITDIGRLGTAARVLAPKVERLLDPALPDIRRGTVLALGWTSDTFWTRTLVSALRDSTDWAVNCAAAVALGNLGDPRAIRDLEDVAGSHWIPFVRDTVGRALARLRSGMPADFPRENVPFAPIWCLQSQGDPVLDSAPPRSDVPDPCETFSAVELKAIRFGSHVSTWDPELGSRVHPTTESPDFACRLEGGILMGGNRGEWGGEILWRSAEGKDSVLDSNATSRLHTMPFGILGIQSSGHMGMDRGRIVLVRTDPGRPPRVQPFLRLPGSLVQSWKTPAGELFIECSHGSLVLGRDGKPKWWPSRNPGGFPPS